MQREWVAVKARDGRAVYIFANTTKHIYLFTQGYGKVKEFDKSMPLLHQKTRKKCENDSMVEMCGLRCGQKSCKLPFVGNSVLASSEVWMDAFFQNAGILNC